MLRRHFWAIAQVAGPLGGRGALVRLCSRYVRLRTALRTKCEDGSSLNVAAAPSHAATVIRDAFSQRRRDRNTASSDEPDLKASHFRPVPQTDARGRTSECLPAKKHPGWRARSAAPGESQPRPHGPVGGGDPKGGNVPMVYTLCIGEQSAGRRGGLRRSPLVRRFPTPAWHEGRLGGSGRCSRGFLALSGFQRLESACGPIQSLARRPSGSAQHTSSIMFWHDQ